MGSNKRDQTTLHHPPHISSLVVRTSGSNDEEPGRHTAAAAVDYDPGDASRDRPSFSKSDRHRGDKGHRNLASSTSPSRRVYEDHQRHGSGIDHVGVPLRGRREAPGRHRDYSPPPYASGRPHGSGFDGKSRNNNPKVQPRDGDWYCQVPSCRNLNFARREHCFKCKKHRYNSPPRLRPLSPRSYRSPPRGWPRDYPPPPPRHDYPPTWRDRERERDQPSRRIASDWVHTEPNPKPHYERRPPPFSPPPPPLLPPRGDRWGRISRERSRSPPPMRGGPDYRRNSYFERGGREDRRRGRDRIGNDY